MVAVQRYPDAPGRQDAYAAACWEPVGPTYAELLATVITASSGGQGGAAWRGNIPSLRLVWTAPGRASVRGYSVT